MRVPVRCVTNLTWQSDRAETGHKTSPCTVVLSEFVSHRRNKAIVNLEFDFILTKKMQSEDTRIESCLSAVEEYIFDRFEAFAVHLKPAALAVFTGFTD